MDNQPQDADDLPDQAEMSDSLGKAIEQIRRETVPESALARVLDRARQIPALDTNPQRERGNNPASNLPSPRRHRMFTIAIRALAAVGTAAASIAAWLYYQVNSTAAADLGAVLTKTAAARTLKLEMSGIVRSRTSDVFVEGQKLRRNLPDGTYQIARDGKAWLVDEKQNRASVQTVPYFRGEKQTIDLLALVGLTDGDQQKQVLAVRPAERRIFDGREWEIYRWDSTDARGQIRIEAVVDAKTQLLESIERLDVRGERTAPICRLTVIARDKPVNEDLFVVGDTLTEDGRIGKVIDAQGLVTIRPVMHDRWTPVTELMPVRPGDWLQTDPRGANAVSVRLVPQTELIVGPGSTIELVSPKQLRISAGEIKIKATTKSPVELVGPDGKKVSITDKQVYRADRKGLVKLDKEPRWLLSYEGKITGDSIGSLLAKIDGRNVPLTVGYHKVTVDIRDQIARTTIEESFVNHTNTTLEGTFFFPLPQDASIAGFGMWIGDKLVEADVVEKQRAREIYETILRERRDPGLLEWSGGNIFKARVFPIVPNSEKRITITYTQVLPLRGNSYRYQYALQSELLKQHPLRQLEIDVKVSSAQKLKSVNSPTHATRNALTAHSAHVEFSAKEYTPNQDFETVVELEGRQSDIVLVPHRRGDDGYFMVQLMPNVSGTLRVPPSNGTRSVPDTFLHRELLPNGEPLELVILADTSASMDAPSRERQAELIATLLAALTPKDKFNLGTCDVDCDWVFARPIAAEARNIETAQQKLAARHSLGWTDLDKATQAALRQCGPKTQVVYIGDGIVTTGDADPVAFTKRLKRFVEGKAGIFHSIAVSSSFEPGVMKAIAAVGGGSFRQVSGSHGPQAVAMELLGEITQPVLRDLKIEFAGLQTARVYPEHLPNLPLGTQQIILGRYRPQGKDQSGEAIVSGTQAGKPVKFTAHVSLKDAEQGNSFIPRLWARMHLDALLEQGASQAIKDEIIALSEEYHIITPYTSLLVLETDADRERFGVKRRFQMRDGEKFFAQGRENANWELIQQQMKRAGLWRLGLRHDVLRELSRLGRDVSLTQTLSNHAWAEMNGPVSGFAFGGGGGSVRMGYLYLHGSNTYSDGTVTMGGILKGDSSSLIMDDSGYLGDMRRRRGDSLAFNREGGDGWDYDKRRADAAFDAPMPSAAPAAAEPAAGGESLDRIAHEEGELGNESMSAADSELGLDQGQNDEKAEAGRPLYSGFTDSDVVDLAESPVSWTESAAKQLSVGRKLQPYNGDEYFGVDALSTRRKSMGLAGRLGDYLHYRGIAPGVDYSWFNNLFAPLPPLPVEPQEPKQPWPAEARAIARSLLRGEPLMGAKDGLRIEIETESFDPRWNALTGRTLARGILSPAAWLTVSESDSSQGQIAWADGRERGGIARAMLLGRVRASKPDDLRQPPLDVGAGSTSPLDLGYQGYSVEIKREGDHRARLLLKHPTSPNYEVRLLIDTARRVLLKIENVNEGKVASTTTFGEFIEVLGAWYAGRIENFDAEGRRTTVITQKFSVLPGGEFGRQWKQELALRDHTQLLRDPLPRLIDAKKALASGKAALEDHVVMLLHFQATQQWDRVLGHLAAAEKLSGKPGMRWVRLAVLQIARKAEEAKKLVLNEASNVSGTLRVPPDGTRSVPDTYPGDQLYLADHLFNTSSSIFEANEQLRLLDALRPVYERLPAHVLAMKRWNESRAGALERAGQSQQVLEIRKQLAADYPHDYNLQQQYARALAGVGEFPAAYAWLDRVLVPEAKWQPYEEECLVTTYADLLRQQGRYDDVVEYLDRWVKRNPPSQNTSQNIYAQYLSALVWSNHEKQANKVLAQWIDEGVGQVSNLPKTEQISNLPHVDARLRAAVSQALGQGYNLYTNRIDERWFKPLGDAAIALAQRPSAASVADQIMGNWYFQQSDECRRVRKAALRMLLDEIGKLPVDQLQRLVNWVSPNNPAVEKEAWQKIAAGLRARWDAEADWRVKNQLGAMLSQVLQGHIGAEAWLDFLRLQSKGAPAEYRAAYAQQLFNALLGQPWKAAYEDEAFGLLDRLSDAEQRSQREAAEIAALCRMTDCMVQARFQDRMKAVEHPEKLTRAELRAKQVENLRRAREDYAERLHKAMAARQGRIVQWMNVERLYLDVQTGRNLEKVADECFEMLPGPLSFRERASDSPSPPAPLPEGEGRLLDDLLHHRCLVTLMNMAARKTAKPALVDRVLAYLEAGGKAAPEETRWKVLQYQLLVALDRPKDLAKRLEAWIAGGDADNGWRLVLGYLQAESGRLPEAIRLFEAVRAADELRGGDYRTLADWYMAVNRRDAYDRARIETYKVIEEWRLSNWLYGKLRPWQQYYGNQQPPPRELDVEVLYVFTALFEKASQPQNYMSQLGQFYAATRDFRLLAGLADAVIGHTAGQVYPFVQSMSGVLGEVRDEATSDEIVQRIAAVRPRAQTDVDRRALDLLELLVERRAAELQNQPGPHVLRALTAMRRAWKRAWSPGEPRLIADLLASLGHIAQQPLAEEQLVELESLYRDAEHGTADHLHIGLCVAQTYWAYSKQDRAVDLLTAALDEYQTACGGVLPASANDAIGTLIGYREAMRHYARGEEVLQEQLRHAANQQQTYWLVQRLYQLYDGAIGNDGEVSLGRGIALYRAVEKQLRKDLATPDQNHRYNLVTRLNAIYRTANNKKLPSPSGRGVYLVADDLRDFAFRQLPELLKQQSNNYTSMVSDTANALHDVAAPRDGLDFLVRRIGNEPGWFRLNNQDGWSQYCWTIAQWREQVKDLGDVEKPLLKIVCDELRRDLHTRQQRNRVIYWKRTSYYWSAKEADFARTAEEVWAEDKQSGAACQYIAEYLHGGLEHYGRAIEILLDAHRREVLDESGQSRLVEYLREQNRFAETLPILEPLVARRPDNLQYRVWLMNAYFKTAQPKPLADLLQKTHDYFHKENRWNENAMAMLGRSCLENELCQKAVDYLAEAIALHQRTAPRRGIGDGTLSGYYADQGRAYAGLKKTPEAVDAAAAAIVAWGNNINNRYNAIQSLKDVLRAAPDLDNYVRRLDKQSAETREENPILRKAIGQVYLERSAYRKAVEQLRIAAEVQPNDAETYKALIDCYDRQNDQQGAIEQLLAWRQLAVRDIKLYEDLGNRLEKSGQAAEAERAFTSIVETLPSESESHQLLAEIRQRENRWPEAVLQWKQVARIRSLEPTGLVNLCGALIHGQHYDEARGVLEKLKQKAWPARFENYPENVREKIRLLEQQLQGKK
jgi:predicted Zn-dependent protease